MITTDVLFNNQDTETKTEVQKEKIDNTFQFQEIEVIINGQVLEKDDKLHNYEKIWEIVKNKYNQVNEDRKFNSPELLDNNVKKLSIAINTKKDENNSPSKKRLALARGGNEFDLSRGVDSKERAKNANGENEKKDSFSPLYFYSKDTGKLEINYEKISSIYINGKCCIASF